MSNVLEYHGVDPRAAFEYLSEAIQASNLKPCTKELVTAAVELYCRMAYEQGVAISLAPEQRQEEVANAEEARNDNSTEAR